MAFAAGQKVTASALNDLISGAYLAADQTVTNSTTLVNATGLAFALAADAVYAIDGWLRWTSNPTADLKVGWAIPGSADGWWTLGGPYIPGSPATAGRERVNYLDTSTVALTSALSAAGDDESTGTIDLSAILRGYITTSIAGTLQLQFAQNTANASDTILGEGSWLRVTRLDA